MMVYPTGEVLLESQRAKEFFLARQPILNRDQRLMAYELLFRSTAFGPANVVDDLSATASVIAHASELGMENVIGPFLGFVNVDAAVLTSDIIQFLPKEKVILEILETVKITEPIIIRIEELVRAGYRFAIDDVTADSEDLRKLLPLVDIVKVDITDMEQTDLSRLVKQFKLVKKKLLAEKVETILQFHNCLDLGFDYFQGYYFAKPSILTGKKLSPSQLAILDLLKQIATEADSLDIEHGIKKDASLGLTLLRLVNTPAVGVAQRIDSLGQAVMVLGRRQLQRWLQILLYANAGKMGEGASPLLTLVTTRGKLLELIATRIKPNDRIMADIAFTVGIMSLMDTLFGMSMQKILAQISVADEVSNALMFRTGIHGEMLQLVECLESIDDSGASITPLLNKLQLSVEELNALQLAAYEWSDTISDSAK